MTLQALYGTIPQIYGKGECARVSVTDDRYYAETADCTQTEARRQPGEGICLRKKFSA